MTGSFDWHKEAETQWDRRAAFWNERSENMWNGGSRKSIIPFIEKHIDKGSSVLDIGCGDGYGSYKLYKSGYKVTGMDISTEMITWAKKRIHMDELNFLQGDVGNLPFGNNSMDGMMAINVLEWTEFPATVLKELYRVLKTDGLVCVGILGPTAGPRSNSYPRLHTEKAICNTMMPWEFQQLAVENNFKLVDSFGVYKDGVTENHYKNLELELKQALSFMWIFMLRKVGE